MIVDPITKKAALFSGLLHLGALLFLILAAIFSTLWAREKEPHVFEMVELPNWEPTAVLEDSVPDLSMDLPEFEPAPVLTQPLPQPAAAPPKPVDIPPPPKLVEKPKPKIISFGEFVEQVGQPETPRTVQIPRKKPTKIDTSEIEKNLRKTVMSVPELLVSNSTAATDSDEMRVWRSLLAARLDQEWKKTNTDGIVGRSVRISFYISTSGSIFNVRVISSSDLNDLDKNGILTVRRLGIFQPPPNREGVTITVTFKVE